jgi:cold-inducible RNA-binding protein
LRLYVGNMSAETVDGDLKAAFAPHGEVSSAEVILDKKTGRCKGFGFVEMANETEAQAALTALNGSKIGGTDWKVNIARAHENAGRPA